ncbi:MAG: hypothetical protein IPO25_23265 [Saprospiraceae bacterium]|nr:hypothetical protein [Saprospiraceae bacterium]
MESVELRNIIEGPDASPLLPELEMTYYFLADTEVYNLPKENSTRQRIIRVLGKYWYLIKWSA